MAQSKSKVPESAKAKDPQKELRRKTFLAALILLVPFLGVMYLIFGGGSGAPQPGEGSFNMTVPEGRSSGIEASKQKALERVAAERQQNERSRLFDDNDFSLLAEAKSAAEPAPGQAIARSRQAHSQAAQVVSSFYAAPAPDPQVEALRRQVAELSEKLETTPPAPDPLALAEKQYALAAKYLHGEMSGTPAAAEESATGPAASVRGARAGVVSTLARFEPDTLAAMGRERNLGFNTPVGRTASEGRHGIRVCVDEDQTLTSGGRIRMRLVESIVVAGHRIEAGSILFGIASIDNQRMKIHVGSISQHGEVIPVSMDAYDLDGAAGLYVPDSQERTALKDAAAAIGSGFGSSISFTRGAGQQVAMDLARGAMTGGTQYLASKMRQVKVSVKAGYQIILLSKE